MRRCVCTVTEGFGIRMAAVGAGAFGATFSQNMQRYVQIYNDNFMLWNKDQHNDMSVSVQTMLWKQ